MAGRPSAISYAHFSRPRPTPWWAALARVAARKVGDLPLIDELDWLLAPRRACGETPVHEDDVYDEVTTLQDRLDASRQAEWGATKTTGFGHIVVDEAQDLSPMQWRLLGRRGEDATWTIVGDPAQATLATPEEWEEPPSARVLKGRRVTRFNLGINYRTPKEIMEYAARASGVSFGDLQSIRSGTEPGLLQLRLDPSAPANSRGSTWFGTGRASAVS